MKSSGGRGLVLGTQFVSVARLTRGTFNCTLQMRSGWHADLRALEGIDTVFEKDLAHEPDWTFQSKTNCG